MTKTVSAGRPSKASQRLSKQLILRTALPIVQEHGVDALSFRVLADKLSVTPMAITYHSGSKQQLLADLIDIAFAGISKTTTEQDPAERARSILRNYCTSALKNANLLRAMLEDGSLLNDELAKMVAELKANTQQLANSDDGDVLVHLLIDYTHGFVLAAAADENNPLTIDDFLRGIDWVLSQATGAKERTDHDKHQN